MVSRLTLGMAAAACLSATTASHGALLNLNLLPHPDVASALIVVNFDAGTGTFTASGTALEIFDGSMFHPLTAGTFDITAQIDGSGNALSGSLQIGGSFLAFGPTLVTGTLTDFGFVPGGGDIFEFLFTLTGGDLAVPGWFGNPGALVGVILDANGSNFDGTWQTSFTNEVQPGFGNGISDTAPIPSPGALALLLVAGLVAPRRRR